MQQPARHRHEPVLKIASGGMATVFLGSLQGALGFRQIVAIKRPHPHLLEHAGFRDELLREARLASGIHHANVVDVRDVEAVGDSVQLVMDYIEGASLGELVNARARDGGRLPPGVAVRVVLDACAGLHAAHELTDDAGRPVGLVHRDVSPQNILVGLDGVARVTDFGIAKCVQTTDPGTSRETLKGKIGYMAPEYVRGQPVDRRADVFALGVVLWEALCGARLFRAPSDGETLERVLSAPVPRVSERVPELAALDEVVARALRRDPAERLATAEALRDALERAAAERRLVASHAEVGRFVRDVVGDKLEERRRALREASRDVATSEPAAVRVEEPSTTRREPVGRRASRSRAARTIVGVLVLAGAAGAAIGVARWATARSTSTPTSTSTSTSTSTPTPTPTPTPPPRPIAAPPHPHAPPRSPTRAPAHASHSHAPPPNPYPSGP